MKVFVINLDKNPERLSWMKEQLDRMGVSFERVPAVLGSALPAKEYSLSTNSFRSLMAYGARLEKGEVGCALSHLSVYRKIVSENLPYALILEDDCTFDAGFSKMVRTVEAFVTADKKQVVLFSAHGIPEVQKRQDDGIVRIKAGACTDAYVVTNAGAKTLLKANFPVVVPCDTWSRFVRLFGVELYRAIPCTVWQDSRFVTENPKNHQPCRGYPKLLWKVFRVFGILVDRMMYILTSR